MLVGGRLTEDDYYNYNVEKIVGALMTDALGQFEQVVLTAILALNDNAYGVTIHAKVEELARPRKITRGAVYATLDRMEDKGLIASWMSEPTPERGGRSRRHYRLEKTGQQALKESARTARRLIDTIAENLGGLGWKAPR
jgi:DNA-binding PadR family transcriptional regulator